MNLSFTLDEKIFNEISATNLIGKASDLGVSSFELSPDTDILELKDYDNIVKAVSSNNLELNYHIPYFANEVYELEYFSLYEDRVKQKYLEFINILEHFQDYLTNQPIIVVHGSNYIENEKQKAMDNTLKFLDWMLNLIDKKSLPFTLAIETLRKKEIRNTLDNRDDIFSILNNFKTDSLKVCLDMCHDKLNFYPKETPLDHEFLKQIVYCHIHGHNLSKDVSHIPLDKSDIDYSLELETLIKSNFKGDINIELLSHFCKDDYLADLFKDIDYMKRFL